MENKNINVVKERNMNIFNNSLFERKDFVSINKDYLINDFTANL